MGDIEHSLSLKQMMVKLVMYRILHKLLRNVVDWSCCAIFINQLLLQPYIILINKKVKLDCKPLLRTQTYFWPSNHAWGAKTKLRFKFDDNRMNFPSYSSLYENPRWRRRPSCFQNFRFLSITVVAAAGLMLHTKFGKDRPYRSKVISISVSHWNA